MRILYRSNAYAKTSQDQIQLLDEIAMASIHNNDTFNLHKVVMTADETFNSHTSLFYEIGYADVQNKDTFNSQELASMVNTYAKLNIKHPFLF